MTWQRKLLFSPVRAPLKAVISALSVVLTFYKILVVVGAGRAAGRLPPRTISGNFVFNFFQMKKFNNIFGQRNASERGAS